MPLAVKAFIVEDEFQSCKLLTKLLTDLVPDIQIIGQASSVDEAYASMNTQTPDLVFLDVMLNEATGFDLLKKFNDINFEIIFTTAHDQFALKAFRFNAIDYLLKPIDPDELQSAVGKAKIKLLSRQFTSREHLENLYQTIRNPYGTAKKIAIPTSDGFILQPLEEIIYCQAVGNYTQFILADKKKLISSYTLKQYDDMLSELNFFRAHKSFLINLDHVLQYRKGEGGTVIMSDGMELEISRRNKESFVQIFKG